MTPVGEPLTAAATLDALVPGGAVASPQPRRMEDLGALYGFALYETTLSAAANGTAARNLTLAGGARDRVIALINGRRVASVWRGDGKGCADDVTLALPPAAEAGAPERLQLLVENTGRLA